MLRCTDGVGIDDEELITGLGAEVPRCPRGVGIEDEELMTDLGAEEESEDDGEGLGFYSGEAL